MADEAAEQPDTKSDRLVVAFMNQKGWGAESRWPFDQRRDQAAAAEAMLDQCATVLDRNGVYARYDLNRDAPCLAVTPPEVPLRDTWPKFRFWVARDSDGGFVRIAWCLQKAPSSWKPEGAVELTNVWWHRRKKCWESADGGDALPVVLSRILDTLNTFAPK